MQATMGIETRAPEGREILESGFRPDADLLASFLVNAFYLVGEHRILELEGGLEGTERLAALGHAVEPGTAEEAAPARYDRAMLLPRAFGYLPDTEGGRWLKAVRRALRPGGLLLLHALDRDRVRDWAYAGAAFDPASGRLTVRPRDFQGAPRGRAVSVRAYNLSELRALLEGAGFALERAYGDWQGAGLAEAETGRIIAVASKPRRARVTRKVRRGIPAGKGGGE